MKLCVAYTAVCGGKLTTSYGARFIATWMQNPPLCATDLIVICNGGPLSTEQAIMFSSLNAKLVPRSNEGWDLGGYIQCSNGILSDYDLVLYCGESVYFHRSGWLAKIVEAAERWGHGMYGVFGSHVVRAHLQTTAFATSPKLLREYPLPVTDRRSRYEMEHGARSFWRLVHRKYAVKLVTWSGVWSPGQWRLPINGLWAGDQSDCLMFCNHTDRFRDASPKRKRNWQVSADRAFR